MGSCASPALAVLLLASAAFGSGEQEGVFPSDPRVIEANALLSDDRQRRRAIDLYREVVEEQPDHFMARMWLARVLAWEGRYDDSLVHYDHFLAGEEPPDWAGVERAEVLSWAGRYEQAEAAFQALLAADPRDARAARGLARVYQWSGRGAEAVVAYERALAIEDDSEAQRDLARLRSQLAGGVQLGSDYSEDSDGFRLRSLRAAFDVDLSFRSKLVARGSYIWLDMDRAASSANDAEAFDASLGIEHRFGQHLVTRARVGGRRWDRARDYFVASGEAEYTVNKRFLTGLSLRYGDFLEHSHSLDAVLEGIYDATLRSWAWFGLHPLVGLSSEVEVSFLGDGNRRIAGAASLDYSPWQKIPVRFVSGLGLLGYTKGSSAYWDPDISVEGSLGAAGEFDLFAGLSFEGATSLGWGYAQQDGLESNGFAYRVSGGPTLAIGAWHVSAQAYRSSSIRSTTYSSWGAGLSVGRGL